MGILHRVGHYAFLTTAFERLIYVNIFCEVGRLTHRFIVSCKLTDVDMVTAGILIFLHLEVDF